MRKVEVMLKEVESGTVIEGRGKKYLIPVPAETIRQEFNRLDDDAWIEIEFVSPEDAVELDRGGSLSSVAMYKARWKLLRGEILEKEERKWEWEAGSAGGSGVKGKYRFKEGSIIWSWIFKDYSEPCERAKLIVVGKKEDYELK